MDHMGTDRSEKQGAWIRVGIILEKAGGVAVTELPILN